MKLRVSRRRLAGAGLSLASLTLVAACTWPAVLGVAPEDSGGDAGISCVGLQVTWKALAPLDMPGATTLAVERDGQIHLFGADHSHHVFDPPTRTWTTAHNLPLSLNGAAAVNGSLLAFADGSDGPPEALAWNAVADTWDAGAPDPWPRRLSATGVIGDKVYLAGGVTDDSARTDVYDPAQNTWADAAPLPDLAGELNAAIVYQDELYLLGVPSGGFGPTQIRIYAPASDTWRPLPSFPEPRRGSRAIVRESTIWLLGGRSESGLEDSIFIYDITTGVWCTGSKLPEPMERFAVAQMGGKIYLMSGYVAGGLPSNHVWEGSVF